MSANIYIELMVRGDQPAMNRFMKDLNPVDEVFSEGHILRLLGKDDFDERDGIVELDVERKDDGKSVALSWNGGFGGFDSYSINESFRDDGILLSEKFPWLEFRLYYDSDGANFAGSYS